MSESDVLIIGAGISGLSTAWWLAEQGVRVEVWESASKIGGKIQSTQDQGYLTEQAAGLVVNFRKEIDHLIDRCELTPSKRARPDDLKRYVLHQNQLCEVPMTFSGIAHSPLWSRQGKLRMLIEGLILGSGEQAESVSKFITRRFGKEMLQTAIDPFVSGTLASDPDLAEAASVLPRLKALEKQYGSITNGILIHKLWKRKRINAADTFSFDGGMSQLIEGLSSHPGIHIRKQVAIKQLSQCNEGWRVDAETPFGERSTTIPHLVLTTPADVSAHLLTDISGELSQLLSQIEYAPLAVMHMGFDQQKINHPLDGTGFLVGKNDRLTLNGNLWMSSLFPNRAPPGKKLLTTYLGGSRHPELMALSDAHLADQALSNLTGLLGIQSGPEYLRIDRHDRGLPLYHGDYQARLKLINQHLVQTPGLHLCGNYAGGVSVRERIFQGQSTANSIARLVKQNRGDTGDAQEAPLFGKSSVYSQ